MVEAQRPPQGASSDYVALRRSADLPRDDEAIVPKPRPVLACRAMVENDIEPAIVLLSMGFPERDPSYWRDALERLRDRAVPAGWARYGYVMTDHERLVGIILTIFSEADDGMVRGNLSSWFVEAAYRGYSNILLASLLKLKGVTLFNISPAPNTIDTIRAQGFSPYVGGTFQTVPALGPSVPGARVDQITSQSRDAAALLADHVRWGCLAFTVSHEGQTYPFVFVRSRFLGGKVPCAQLVYGRTVEDFVRFARPLGHRLLRHGLPVVMIDATGPIRGLRGIYRPGRGPRFFRGDMRPRIGDLSYTELAIFGP